jgi:hypothetical protein
MMKSGPPFFIVILAIICFLLPLDACDDLFVTWQKQELTDMRDYHSPAPLYNLMVPTASQTLGREIVDLFMQEDQTDYPSATSGNPTERTDQSLEEYFDTKITLGSSDPKFQTYGDSSFSTALGTRNGQNPKMPARGITMQDITTHPAGQVNSFIALKMTGGLIYKTDQVQCQTPYEHPTTLHESDSSAAGNHSLYLNESGNLTLNSDDSYCFFLLIPKSENLGPFLSRVHESDEDSLSYIKNGLAPYIPLLPNLLPRLDRGAGDLVWAKGRYLLPTPGGKISLAQNGLNLLFNRVTIYRFYHYDRHKLTYGVTLSTRVWNALNRGLVPPVPATLALSPDSMFTVHGTTTPLKGLEINEDLMDYYQETPIGDKASSWGYPWGPQYMALPPEDNPIKRWPFVLLFPTGPAERKFMELSLSSAIPINENRNDPKDVSSYGNRALPVSDLNQELTLARRFQFYMKTDYEMPAGDVFSISAGDESIMECDADPQVLNYCTTYGPLISTLEALFGNLSISMPYNDSVNPVDFTDPNPTDLMLVLLNGTASETITVGSGVESQSWTVHPHILKIKLALQDPLFSQLEMDQKPPRPKEFNLFMNRTVVGRKLGALSQKINNSLSKDDARYSDSYYKGPDENSIFVARVTLAESACASQPTTALKFNCMAGSMTSLISDRYEAMELDNPVSGGSFRYYTANENSGKRLMTKLALIQEITGSPGTLRWKHMLPPQVLTLHCDKTLIPIPGPTGDAAIENCITFFKEENNVPIADDSVYETERYPPGLAEIPE